MQQRKQCLEHICLRDVANTICTWALSRLGGFYFYFNAQICIFLDVEHTQKSPLMCRRTYWLILEVPSLMALQGWACRLAYTSETIFDDDGPSLMALQGWLNWSGSICTKGPLVSNTDSCSIVRSLYILFWHSAAMMWGSHPVYFFCHHRHWMGLGCPEYSIFSLSAYPSGP